MWRYTTALDVWEEVCATAINIELKNRVSEMQSGTLTQQLPLLANGIAADSQGPVSGYELVKGLLVL